MSDRRMITVRTEADLLALIPSTFGFHPEDSLVLVTASARSDPGPCHARIDLPADVAGVAEAVDQLLVAAVRSRADQALVVAYTEDECVAELAVDLLVGRLAQAGVETVVAIRADGARWFPLGLGADDPRAAEGVAYDVRSHAITSQSVLDGKVTFRNRRELAGSLAVADLDDVERVAAAAVSLGPLPQGVSLLAAEGRWLLAEVYGALAGDGCLPVEAAARILRALSDKDLRDLVWCEMSRDDAEAHARLWRQLLQRSPEDLAAPVAGLVAFAAWLSGDGALAWCAVERALCADPDHTLARLVGQALETAMPPSCWQPVDRGLLRLDAEMR